MGVLGKRLDLMVLEVIFSLNDSVSIVHSSAHFNFFPKWGLSYSTLLPVCPVVDSQLQCAAAGLTSSASQFPWAISLLSLVNTSLLLTCLLTPAGARLLFVPAWHYSRGWAVGNRNPLHLCVFSASVMRRAGNPRIPLHCPFPRSLTAPWAKQWRSPRSMESGQHASLS